MSSGKLTLQVVEAANLTDKDWFGKMDPYVKLELNQSTRRTTTIAKGGTACSWNQEFGYSIASNLLSQSLIASVWDEDLGFDDFIGRCMIPVSRLCSRPASDEWYNIVGKDNKVSGKLRISTKWMPDTPAPSSPVVQRPSYPDPYPPQPIYVPQPGPPQPGPPQPSPYPPQPIYVPQPGPPQPSPYPPPPVNPYPQHPSYTQLPYPQHPSYTQLPYPQPQPQLPQLTGDKRQDATIMFKFYDKDNSRTISMDEFLQALRALRAPVGPENARAIFAVIATNGSISEQDFVDYYVMNYTS